MKNKKFHFPLFLLLIVFSVIPLILAVVIISVTSFQITKNNLEDSAKNTLYIAASNLANHCSENEISVMNVSNYYSYLDSLKDNNIEMAILLQDGTCATSIKNENDYRIREIVFEKDMSADGTEIRGGYFDNAIEIDGKVYCAYYLPITVKDEITGMAFAGELQSNVTGVARSAFVVIAGIACALIVLFAVLILVFTGSLLKSFDAVDRNVNDLASGYLGRSKKDMSPVREMNHLLKATASMQENLAETIGKVKNISNRLAENVAEAAQLSRSSSDRARQITESVEELSLSATDMSENVQEIHGQMLEIGNCVNDISESVEQLYGSSEIILQTNDEAKMHISTIMKNSRNSVNAVDDIASQIKETNDSITEIDKAVELILAISEQTKLLSLNASIEAARAGENGRGFAVVAEEIGNLSRQSAEGAEMIKNLAKKITEESEKSVRLADEVHELILSEQESVSKTQNKYAELSDEINLSVNEIRTISEKTVHLSDYKEKVIGKVSKLNSLSGENIKNSEEVNVNITEIISEVQTVSENCEKMNLMADELKSAVSYFHD